MNREERYVDEKVVLQVCLKVPEMIVGEELMVEGRNLGVGPSRLDSC